jgi:adenylosuccinate synthase
LDFFNNLNAHSAIVIEGSQGVGLDVNHGLEYPYVSSGSFTTYGLLDGVGVMLAPHDIVMCMKPYVSYFGKQALHPFEEPDFRTYAGEFGSTTKRPRKLSWLDLRWLEQWTSLVRPTHLVINHFDTINWFSHHNKAFYLHDKAGDTTAILQEVWKDGKITHAGSYLVDMIQDVVEADKVYVGIGPKKEDIVECV